MTKAATAKGRNAKQRKPASTTKLTAAQQRGMILNMFFDEDSDADGFLDLVKHCRIDLAACHGDAEQIPNVIAAHYRIAQGRYDIDRAANDLLTYPPIAAYIAELQAAKAKTLASRFGRSR